jgi:hypothetical protein
MQSIQEVCKRRTWRRTKLVASAKLDRECGIVPTCALVGFAVGLPEFLKLSAARRVWAGNLCERKWDLTFRRTPRHQGADMGF